MNWNGTDAVLQNSSSDDDDTYTKYSQQPGVFDLMTNNRDIYSN